MLNEKAKDEDEKGSDSVGRLTRLLRVYGNEALGLPLLLQLIIVIVFALAESFGLHSGELLDSINQKVMMPSAVFSIAILVIGCWLLLPQKKYRQLAAEARETIDEKLDHKLVHSMDGKFQFLVTLMVSIFASMAIFGEEMTRLGSILTLFTTGLFLASYQGAQVMRAIDLKLLVFSEAIAFAVASLSILFWILIGYSLYLIDLILANTFTIALTLLAVCVLYVDWKRNLLRTRMRKQLEALVKDNYSLEKEEKSAALGFATSEAEFYFPVVLGALFFVGHLQAGDAFSQAGFLIMISFAAPFFLNLFFSYFSLSHLFRGGVMPEPPDDLPPYETGPATRRSMVIVFLILIVSLFVSFVFNLV